MKRLMILILCCLSLDANSIEISNFKAGLMCGINKDTEGRVCFVQRDIQITGQSSCIANGQTKKCTWYGFSFEYEDADKTDIIKCKYNTTRVIQSINTEEVVDKSVDKGEFSFSMDEESGEFMNPQYAVMFASDDNLVIGYSTVCKVENEELFSYTFNLIYPTK